MDPLHRPVRFWVGAYLRDRVCAFFIWPFEGNFPPVPTWNLEALHTENRRPWLDGPGEWGHKGNQVAHGISVSFSIGSLGWGGHPPRPPSWQAAGMARRWRMDFDAASDLVEATLRSLRRGVAGGEVRSWPLGRGIGLKRTTQSA